MFSLSFLTKLLTEIEENPRVVRTVEQEEMIFNIIDENPNNSTRKIGTELRMGYVLAL